MNARRKSRSVESEFISDLINAGAKAVKAKGNQYIDDFVEYLQASLQEPESQQSAEADLTPDPYLILGLEPDASKEDVKTAFRTWVKENRPDLGHKKEEFQRIRAAYEQIMGVHQ